MTNRLTPEAVRDDVARLLHREPGEVPEADDLFECGLDSIRLMSLLERWRDAGVAVSFVALVEQPTLENWVRLLTTRLPAALDA